MLKGEKELRHYQTEKGDSPFLNWLHHLRDRQARSIIRNRLERFAEGNPGNWRAVGMGVFEIKIYFGPGYRVYFGLDGPTLILLLLGGDKSTQTIDIAKAQRYWADYERRKHATEPPIPG